MRLMGLEFHFNRINAKYKDEFNIECVLILINRCRKMYSAVQHLVTVFKLLERKKVQGTRILDERIVFAVKTLLQDHTLFPV